MLLWSVSVHARSANVRGSFQQGLLTLFGADHADHADHAKDLISICGGVQSTYGIASMARSAVLISRHAKAAAAHQAAMREANEDTSA